MYLHVVVHEQLYSCACEYLHVCGTRAIVCYSMCVHTRFARACVPTRFARVHVLTRYAHTLAPLVYIGSLMFV